MDTSRPEFLILNWKGPNDPEAGGAEKYCLELALNAIEDGFKVIWISKKYKSRIPREDTKNIQSIQVGNKFTFYLWYFFKSISFKPAALLVSVNSIPFIHKFIRTRHRLIHIHHLIPYSVMKQKIGVLAPISFILQNYILRLLYKNENVSTNGIGVKNELCKIGLRHVRQIRTVVDGDFSSTHEISKLVVAPGALRPWKRPIDIILGYKKSKIDADLVIFGRPENEQLLTDIDQVIESNGLRGRVLVMQDITEEKKSELYRTARLAIVASVKEGVGLTSLEPQAYGCPVVAYDVPGINESVDNQLTGILVENGNIDLLGNAIKQIYQNEELRSKMAEQCIKKSLSFGSKDAYNEFKIALYSEA